MAENKNKKSKKPEREVEKVEKKEVEKKERIEATEVRSKLTPLKKVNLKLIIPLLFLTLLLVGGYLLYKSYFLAATVNGEPISRLEVIETLEQQGSTNILESLIVRKLIKQEAARRNVVITTEEIQQEIQEIESQYAAQGLTIDDLLAYQNMTRKSLEEQLELQKMLEKLVGTSFIVSDEEVDQYIEANAEAFEEVTDELKGQIKEQLKGQKQQEEMQAFIEQKRQEAQIEYYYYKSGEQL